MRRNSKDSPAPLTAAAELFQCGKLKEAEKLLRSAISGKEGDGAALAHLLAQVLLQQGRAADAVRWAEEAVSAVSGNPTYYDTLGDAYKLQLDIPKAISVWHTSLYAMPLQAGVMEKLAASYRDIGDAYAAIDYYRQAIELFPRGELHYALAKCFHEAGLLEDARLSYGHAYSAMPFHLPLLRDASENLLVLAHYDVCTPLLKTSLDYYPQDACLWHLQGLLLFRTDMFDEALTAYEQALLWSECTCRDLLLDYAVCLRTVGDDASAEKVLVRVREMNP
jgi:protein O-GlcNAc transferase